MKQSLQLNPLVLLKLSLNNLFQNPILIYPTVALAFIQLLILELLYFAPRYPLSELLGPLIRYVWAEEFLHYPMDLVLLPKMFYYAQVFISIFIGSFLIGVTARMVTILNDHPVVKLKTVLKETSMFYIHILCASLLSFYIFKFSAGAYVTLLAGVQSNPSGKLSGILGRTAVWTPYVEFFMGIAITTLLVFVIPIIVVENKKILPALILNVKILARTFPTILLIVFIPTMFYLPVLIMRNNIEHLLIRTAPDMQVLVIMTGIIVTTAIDLLIVTAVTTYYLFIKEHYEKTS